ncbi:MAG: tail protein X [Campylobacteraceae bacterium]|jgi:phage tail protein X|nr:tail protein X [Campylobacteraceae bacterium]
MTEYKAYEGERLDEIVYKHYGTLEVFEQVLMLNARLPVILQDGDIVKLPDIVIEPVKEAELW